MSNEETTSKKTEEVKTKRNLLPLVVLLIAALAALGLTWFLTTIFSHKQESTQPFTAVTEINDKTYDPAVWGQNFPLQYEGYKATSEMQPEDTVKNTEPSVPEDTRATKTHSKLAIEPRLVSIWKGYAFSVEYNEPRGHEYMMIDQQFVKRMTDFDQPGACMNCHVSLPQVMDELGDGDRAAGWAKMNKLPYKEAAKAAHGPVACIDCHEPGTMKLRVVRPAFIEGIKAYKASIGVPNFDVNKDATTQEMRSYVCAQCHVEYYFKGDEKTLTFPWTKGLTVDDAMAYYDEAGFKDFTHKDTGADVIKAQHPDFETWANGIHAKNGVSCADCHMAYNRDGAAKVSDHQVRSPMINEDTINASCLTCHHSTTTEMKERVDTIQNRYLEAKNTAFTAVQALIDDIVAEKAAGTVSDENLQQAYQYQRKAQFIVDYSFSENSLGFHAPQYSIKILNEATDYARSGQLALRGVKVENQRTPDSYDIKPVPRPGAK